MCRAFASAQASRGDKQAALRAAVKNHGRLTKEALMGGGWDRHLFALKAEARAQGLPEPALYATKAYQTLSEVRGATLRDSGRHFILPLCPPSAPRPSRPSQPGLGAPLHSHFLRIAPLLF